MGLPLKNLPLRKITLGLAALLWALVLPLYGAKVYLNQDYTDFLVYHRAATRFAQADWVNLYNPAIDGNCPFRYAPMTLPFFRPLALIPYSYAKVFWFVLNYASYGLGFYLLFTALREIERETDRKPGLDPLWATALSSLFVLRFCLDSFTIGQITGPMFACFAGALLFFLRRRIEAAAAFLVPPSLLKIGPALLYGCLETPRLPLRAIRRGLAITIALFVFLLLYTGSATLCLNLLKQWLSLSAHGSSVLDSAHYGSQAIHSAGLRLVKAGIISAFVESVAYLALASAILFGLFFLWFGRRAQTLRLRAIFFSLGVFAYLWLMPFTFKYSLPLLAFPVALFMTQTRPWPLFDRIVFAFGALTLSIAGLDIIGSTLFFALQKASIPLLAMLLLSIPLVREARQGSQRR